jgi:hypothetical protein
MSGILGELKLVELRRLWTHEAKNFTPWLAQPENMARLSAAIGVGLEVENTEVACGPYAADILARTTSGAYVVIENQLEKTNHDHLGKAITYAAVLGAQAIVWIAAEFTEEHKKALDWLNDNSVDMLGFFGVQPELWSIDGSRPALRFNVLSRPAEVVRQANAQKASSEISESRQLQLAWWTAFRDALAATKAVPSLQTPRPQHWYDVTMGRTGFYVQNVASTYEPKMGVRLYLSARHGGAQALEKLLAEKATIEAEIGASLLWDANPEAVDKTVSISREAHIERRDQWPEYCKWMVEMTVRFRTAFGLRIRSLELVKMADA